MQVKVGVLALALLGAVVLLLGCTPSRPSRLLLTNNGTEPIAAATVLVGGEKFEKSTIAVGETWQQEMNVRKEGGFVVNIRFVSGRAVHKELGYVTRGIGAIHTLTALDNDVTIKTTVQN